MKTTEERRTSFELVSWFGGFPTRYERVANSLHQWTTFKVVLLAIATHAFAALPPKPSDLPWSFQRLARPAVPKPQNAAWPKDDLDRFILAKLEAAKLSPNADASRVTLIRRVAYDLTGLPPTWEEVSAFVRDPSNDDAALAKVVDSYLKSPRFGERWARHWLDVVRYADSSGRTWNAPITYAWKYRDWVIDSFNSDKPYNRFVAEQIAGDLLPAKTVEQRREQIIGTGLLALGAMDLTEGSAERFTMDQIDDQIDVTTRAFLGMTIACARCHDHKTDPVSQKDYYALAGLFYSTRTLPGTAHKGDMTSAGYVDPEMLIDLPAKLGDKVGPPAKLPEGVHSMADYSEASSADRKSVIKYDADAFFAIGVLDAKPQNCELAVGGDPYERGAAPHRGAMEIPTLPKMPPVAPGASGRLELANWITQPTHPLTARVMVNRVWAHLFGKGIVRTVDDFGMTGSWPKNQELLDHLAVRFVVDGWSVKKLLRAIMLSHAYRQDSAIPDSRNLNPDSSTVTKSGTNQESGIKNQESVDPDNDLIWRVPPRRLEFEAIRDAMLMAAGELKLDRPQGIQVAGTGGKGNTGRTRSLLDLESPYRTIYLPVLRDLLPDAYSTFDFPPPTQIKGQRDVTTAAPQSLWFMNSGFSERIASAVAERESDVAGLYRLLLSREPTAEEVADAKELIAEAGLVALAQALIGSAEFRYVF